MKKSVICLALFFLFVGTICFAQSNNDAQRILGTWKCGTGDRDSFYTYTFNSNGTFVYKEFRR